ncbi:MAG: hypothetical protein AAF585_20115, partial [Verrucomicrobiota bacterium]
YKRSYLGYTATPFANVIQDRNDVPDNAWELTYKTKQQEKSKFVVTQVLPGRRTLRKRQARNKRDEDECQSCFHPANSQAAQRFVKRANRISN